MEAALLVADMVVLMLLLIWGARHDAWGSRLSGGGLFDYSDGAECEDSSKPVSDLIR
jgi:hypothetical protein